MPESKASWRKVRKFFNDIHLWLGIGAGLILFVVCLTGTIYAFRTEIEQMVDSEKYFVDVPEGAEPLPAETLMAQLEGEMQGGKVSSLSIPANPERSYTVSVAKEGERRGTNYLVNPYTGEVLGGTEGAASEFFMFMFRLHRWLLLDTAVGRPIVGVATIIFIFIILTGWVIWFPVRVKSWRQGLKIKWNANWKRVNHDLHNALGFYASIFLLIMGLTGLFWSFEWSRNAWYAAWGVENSRGGGPSREGGGPQGGSEQSTSRAITADPLPIAELLALADRELPYKGNYRISLPGPGEAAVSISKNKTGFFAGPAGDQLSLNAYSGQVLEKEVFAEKPFNERAARSVKALHVGDVFGTFSKIIYFIACLIGTSLPVTGTIIWINKLRKKTKRKKLAVKKAKAEFPVFS